MKAWCRRFLIQVVLLRVNVCKYGRNLTTKNVICNITWHIFPIFPLLRTSDNLQALDKRYFMVDSFDSSVTLYCFDEHSCYGMCHINHLSYGVCISAIGDKWFNLVYSSQHIVCASWPWFLGHLNKPCEYRWPNS